MPPPTAPPKPPSAPLKPLSASPVSRKLTVRKAQPIVPRIFLYAVEKFGKTTSGAYSEEPVILMARDTGYDTLVSAGLAPAVPSVLIETWSEGLAWLDALITDQQGRKTLVLDGITGFERLCHEHVVEMHYDGDWSTENKGFLAYNKGPSFAVTEWLKFLSRLDKLQSLGMMILMLGHARTKAVRNPMGADYDRFEPDVAPPTWGATAKWADVICFGKFHSLVDVGKREASKKLAEQKGKAIGGTVRVLFTQPHDAFVAGNRYGMDSEIWLEKVEAPDMWNVLITQIRKPPTE